LEKEVSNLVLLVKLIRVSQREHAEDAKKNYIGQANAALKNISERINEL
jgi:hypothetical protein